MVHPSRETIELTDARRRRGYRGTNYRALIIEQEKRRRREARERLYTYAAVAMGSGLFGVWLGIILTNLR